MKKYFLKPGTYSTSSGLSSGESQGLNLENYVVSVINNPTCCPKNLGGGGGGGIEGEMIAMATATGTPAENGQSIIDAYNSVAGKHKDVSPDYPIFEDWQIEISSLGIGSGIWPAGMSGPAGYLQGQSFSNLPITGKKYVGSLPLVGGGTTDFYFILLDSQPGPGVFTYYYCTYGDETTTGEGFFQDATGIAYDKQSMTMFPYNSFSNIDLTGNPLITFREVTTVKPVVILPPGVYELPSELQINQPVDFVGMDMNSTLLNTGAGIKVNYGHCWQMDFMTNTNLLGDISGLVDQAITFSNMTINMGVYTNVTASYTQEIYGDFSGIVFDKCVLNGGVANIPAVPFGFVKYTNCELPAGHRSFTNASGIHVTVSDCLFKGKNEVVNPGAYFSGEVIFGSFMGSQQAGTFILDNNEGTGLNYNINSDTISGLELIARRTLFNKIRQTGSSTTYSNFVGDGDRGATVISYCESALGVDDDTKTFKALNYNVNIS